MAGASGIRAGAAYVELHVRDNRLTAGLKQATQKLQAFGAGITSVGTKFLTLGAALGAPLLLAAKTFADMGSDLLDMSQRTGVAVEALSGLRYAAEQSGAGAEELEKGLRTMNRTVIEAARGSASARQAFGRLGIAVEDLSGLSPDRQFELIADRLFTVQNPANRATIAMEIFGKTGAQLLPLLSTGAEGIQELLREADRLGLTMSTDDAQAAEAFGDSLSALWKSLKQVVFAVGGALAPTLKDIAQWVTQVAAAFGDWIDENREVVTIVGGLAVGLVAVGAAMLILGPLITGIGTALGLVGAVITGFGAAIGLLGAALAALLSPIGLVVAAVAGITAALVLSTDQGNQALGSLSTGFESLLGAAGTAWQGIKDAIAAGDLPGAMEVAWLGIQVVWQTGIAALSSAWRGFKEYFVDLFWSGIYAVAGAFNTVWTGIEVAFWTVVNAMANGWDTFCTGLQIAFNEFVGFFRRAWARVRSLLSPQAAQREVAAINQEVEAQNREARNRLNQRVSGRGQQTEQAREAGQQRQNALMQAQEQERMQRQAGMAAAGDADQQAVANARRALDDRVAELAAQREQAELQRQMAGTDGDDRRRSELDLEGLDEAETKTDAKGTFNALAIQGMGSDSLSERTARATEQVATNTRRLVQEAQHGGLVFA